VEYPVSLASSGNGTLYALLAHAELFDEAKRIPGIFLDAVGGGKGIGLATLALGHVADFVAGKFNGEFTVSSTFDFCFTCEYDSHFEYTVSLQI
jgi:hypothetical protein